MGRVTHFEIHADDPARAIVFYESVFGWEISKWDGSGAMDYWLVMTGKKGSAMQGREGQGIDGAIVQRRGHAPTFDNPVSAFVCTIEVDNLDESAKKVTKNAGNIVVDKMPVPGVGWLAYAKDTEGNTFGLMQPDESTK